MRGLTYEFYKENLNDLNEKLRMGKYIACTQFVLKSVDFTESEKITILNNINLAYEDIKKSYC